jgi:nucleotide-binding universal stress UspA family protein
MSERRETMFKKILYPTDFSDVANSAMAYLKKLKDAGLEEVVIMHVLDRNRHDPVTVFRGDNGAMLEIEKGWEESAMVKMNTIADELREAGLKVKIRVEVDSPFRGIVRVEEDENVSATVIGSHGISNIQEMFLGSVAEKVIRKSRRPVFVVKR